MAKRRCKWIFILLLIVQCLVMIVWGTKKARLNIDEMFTMGGVRQGGYGMRYWDWAEDFYGNEHTRQELLDHMTVNSDDLLIHQGISEVYDALIHREFYYSVLNLASTFYSGHIPWGVGVGLNLLFFAISQILLYLIVRETLGEVGALCTVAAYGFSAGAISTVLYVRCYMMLTMYVLLLIYLYLKFMHAEKVWQKILYIVSFDLMAVVSYRTHQFGTILFAIVTALFIIYMISRRKKNCLIWLGMGYGIPFLLGSGIVLAGVHHFFGGSVATLFYSIVGNMDVSQLTTYIIQLLCTIAKHLFVRFRIMLVFFAGSFLLCGRIMYVRHKNQERYSEGVDIFYPIVIISAVTVMIYYSILLLGTAVDWKYLSPVYPLIVLAFMSMVIYISRIMEVSFRIRVIMAGGGILLIFTSYDTQHISELFAEEAKMQDTLEAQYNGVNGIMIHHDVQGDGENCLYEAATLWPEESNVLVLQHHVLLEENSFRYRNEDQILLWLTADFDREESIELFKKHTDYTDIKLILNTDHVWVYECNR